MLLVVSCVRFVVCCCLLFDVRGLLFWGVLFHGCLFDCCVLLFVVCGCPSFVVCLLVAWCSFFCVC